MSKNIIIRDINGNEINIQDCEVYDFFNEYIDIVQKDRNRKLISKTSFIKKNIISYTIISELEEDE